MHEDPLTYSMYLAIVIILVYISSSTHVIRVEATSLCVRDIGRFKLHDAATARSSVVIYLGIRSRCRVITMTLVGNLDVSLQSYVGSQGGCVFVLVLGWFFVNKQSSILLLY
jgi:hypothetical protein